MVPRDDEVMRVRRLSIWSMDWQGFCRGPCWQRIGWLLVAAAQAFMLVVQPVWGEDSTARPAATLWRDEVVAVREDAAPVSAGPHLTLLQQDFERLEISKSVIATPLRIGDRDFVRGLGTHSVSHLRVSCDDPLVSFSAWVGVDHNVRTQGGLGSVTFIVAAEGKELHRTGVMRGGEAAQAIEVALNGVKALDLCVTDGSDGPACDHADWAEARVTTRSGKQIWLEQLPLVVADVERSPFPFSFTYDGQPSREVLKAWVNKRQREMLGPDRDREILSWEDPHTGLRVHCELIRYLDFPAVEWLVTFENSGDADTKVVEHVNACDLVLGPPLAAVPGFLLHRTKGGVPDPTHFEATTDPIDTKHPQVLRAGNGRSSTEDFPFFKIDTGRGSVVLAQRRRQLDAARGCLSARHGTGRGGGAGTGHGLRSVV